MKQPLYLSVADIHGNKTQYQKLRQVVLEKGVTAVFLCGDLLPKDGGSWHLDNKIRTIAMQKKFIDDFFMDYLADLGKITEVYAIFGNDDFKSNYPKLVEANLPNVYFLDNQVVRLSSSESELYVAGYPYVGITPFLHKDWEKWDTTPNQMPHKTIRTDGYVSADSAHHPVEYSQKYPSTIADDLNKLAKQSDPAKTIYIFHEAPYDTPLDMIAPDNKYIKDDHLHIGSRAIREFVEIYRPLVTMHGHIHETAQQSGDFKWQCGSSVSFTAANDFSSDTLSYVLFSPEAPADTKRLSV